MKYRVFYFFGIVMLFYININAQSSMGLTGYWGLSPERGNMLNSFESNPSNYSLLKDWGLALSYGSEFSGNVNSNLYLISLSKRIGSHTVSVRYTPGYQKQFIFSNGESIVLEDSTSQSLSSDFNYKELFGFGYSYKITPQVSTGFTMRYFSQEFNNEVVKPVFTDTLYLVREKDTDKAAFWKADIGINFSPSKYFSFSLSSVNLLNFGETPADTSNKKYEIRKDKRALFGLSAAPIDGLSFNSLVETNGSFMFGFNQSFKLFEENFALEFSVIHDRTQQPFIAGIVPALSYSNELFSVTLSGVKYLYDRGDTGSFSAFAEKGIENVLNNRYSYNKAILTFTFTLNTLVEQSVQFIGVDVLQDIYPTFSDNYLTSPFAQGIVLNKTDKPVTVKPASKISGITEEWIQSPNITILPGDTAKVSFFTIIPNNFRKDKTEISYTDFYLITSGESPDDVYQAPVLVYNSNAWDGRVLNLRYFIKKDFNFSMQYAKKVLSESKKSLDTLSAALAPFYKTKILFNNFISNMVYSSDPRASAEYVQFPHETISLKGGDCDDLSVGFSSLLESVGIQTALVDYKAGDSVGHVNLLVNTELSPNNASLITRNDTKYFLRKNSSGKEQVWIPIETTSLSDFNTAWDIASEKFKNDALNHLGLAKGTVEIIDVY